MLKLARLFLVLVLVLDVLVVTLMLSGGTTQVLAQETPAEARPQGDEAPVSSPTRWTREALQLLGKELTARAEELEARRLELEEAMRSVEVLKRAAGNQEKGRGGNGEPADGARASTAQSGSVPDAAARQELFTRLRKTYENMEPESAASALSQLAMLDKEAVIELILGWKPSVAGAMLDALTLGDPALAADLSYGIWLRSGKNKPGVASAR